MFSKCETVLLFNTENNPDKTIEYITNIKSDFCVLINYKKKKSKLFISSLEKKPTNNKIDIKTLNKYEDVFKILEKEKIIGLNFSSISKKLFDFIKKKLKGITLIDISQEIEKSRLIKKNNEIKKIQKAVEITEKILSKTIKKISQFKYEIEVVKFIKKQIIEEDVEQSFEPIVASGINSSNPHYYPTKKSKLNKGFCIIDMGVKFKNYCSDMTRTIFIGKPTKKDLEFYKEVYDEMKNIQKNTKEGSKKIDIKFKMIHALGHGIGLDVHEQPFVGNQELKKNMTIAIEPAKYDKNKGVRIEDNFIVQKNKIKRFGKLSQKLKIIKIK